MAPAPCAKKNSEPPSQVPVPPRPRLPPQHRPQPRRETPAVRLGVEGFVLYLAPGDIFPTQDAAAIDAGNYARGLPQQAIEYGGWIYHKGNGYSYNIAPGTPFTVPRETRENLRKQCPTPPTAAWHTHPDPGNQNPRQNDFSENDKEFALKEVVPLYLKTPMGQTLVYDPPETRVVK